AELRKPMAKTGFKPDVFTCNTIVNLLCYMGNTKIAVNLLETEQGGVEPDLVTYNAIIAKLCQDKLITDALNLFSEMKNKGVLPDCATCICLILCAYNLGQCKEARRLLNEMVDMIPAAGLFPLFVDALLNKRLVSYGQAVFDTVIQRGEQPDISTDARQVFELMISKGIRPDDSSYNMMANGYWKSDCIVESSLFTQMWRVALSPDTATYCSAKNVFKEFSATIQSTIHMVTFSPMLDGLCNHGFLDEALDLLQEMDDDEVVPNIICYNIIFDCICNSGLIESIGQARIQLEMFSGLPAKGLHPNVITCNIFISGLFKEGLSNEAYGFFQKMEDHGCLPDSYSYNTIIKGFLRNNYASKAMHLLDEMV
ncbi:LOW QUALITY PROTEIN: PPR_1 domain-containing protein/PPR_2 domain-containing protein, partial [Cephalotus follicularis]